MKKNGPEPPDPNDEDGCLIRITHIKFNFDQTTCTNDALNIRIDRLHEVSIPEWNQTKWLAKQSPAAYALKQTKGRTVYIQCRFRIEPTVPKSKGKVKAKGGGILGAIDPITVHFVNGVSRDTSHPGDQEYVQIPLTHRSFSAITRKDIKWEWYYQCSDSQTWYQMDKPTRHRIYVVLDEPPAPWSQTDAQIYPWTKALDYAILNANTSGISDESEAAALIVQHVNAEPLQYDINNGAPAYFVWGGTFLIDDWLAGFSNGPIVNCYDCAAAVTTFSNGLGCHVSYQFHDDFGFLHPVYPIGRGLCNNPFYAGWPAPYNVPLVGGDDANRTGFGNHAYSKQAGNNYDACMRASIGCAKALAYLVLGFFILVASLGMAASLARRLFMKAAGWLIDMSQTEYEGLVSDTSTPAEAALDGGSPVAEPLDI